MTILVIACCALLYTYHKTKQSFPQEYGHQTQLLEQFKAFVASNLALELDEKSTRKFLHDTSHTATHFQSIDIINLRHLLYDNAQSLVALTNRSNHSEQTPNSQTEIVELKQEMIAWFKDVANLIDDLFAAEMKLKPSFADVWLRIFNVMGRAIRA